MLKDILKEQRKKFNLTQTALANKVNISISHHSDIECGRCNPSLKIFSKLAAILDIDMNIIKDNFNEEESI